MNNLENNDSGKDENEMVKRNEQEIIFSILSLSFSWDTSEKWFLLFLFLKLMKSCIAAVDEEIQLGFNKRLILYRCSIEKRESPLED